MVTSPTSTQGRQFPARRGVLLLCASLLLHLLVFNWTEGRLGFPSMHQSDPVPVATVMLTAPAAKPVTPRPPLQQPKPRTAPLPAVAPATANAAPLEDAPASNASVTDAPATDASAPSAAMAAPSEAEPVLAESAQELAKRYKIAPPPSAVLQYDVQALRKGQNWHGTGVFAWEAADGHYRINGEASITVLFKIGVLNFKSEGALTETGITPVLYSEKPWRKSLMNTHFRHAERLISFSASEATYPYHGGEQDRASIIWQLAGIGRGDVAQFAPGTELDVFVAGTRNAESWRIRVLGEEEIDTPYGKLAAWHVVRAPRPGTYDQQIDIWLAPQQDWYPARIRYTYANGDHLDMSLSGIARGTAQ
jgi:hypothetical protein